MHNLYEITRTYRDHAWNAQGYIAGTGYDDDPQSDAERWWYLQGKAEAFAAVMSELERAR